MTEHSREDILHPVIGKPDAAASAHHCLADDPVPALKGNVSLDAVAVIRLAIAHKDRASAMDHDLANDPVTSKLLPGEIKCFAHEGWVDVSGSGHRRGPSSAVPDRKVEPGAPQAMLRNCNALVGSYVNSCRSDEMRSEYQMLRFSAEAKLLNSNSLN